MDKTMKPIDLGLTDKSPIERKEKGEAKGNQMPKTCEPMSASKGGASFKIK
jgi:hypothetical protein